MKKLIIGMIIGYVLCLCVQQAIAVASDLSAQRVFNRVFTAGTNTIKFIGV